MSNIKWKIKLLKGRSPCLVVMGGDSCSEGRGFESQHYILDGNFLTFICCQTCNACLKRRKKQKEAMDGPFFKKIKILIAELFPKMVLRYWSPDFTSAISRVTWRGRGWGWVSSRASIPIGSTSFLPPSFPLRRRPRNQNFVSNFLCVRVAAVVVVGVSCDWSLIDQNDEPASERSAAEGVS